MQWPWIEHDIITARPVLMPVVFPLLNAITNISKKFVNIFYTEVGIYSQLHKYNEYYCVREANVII